MAQRDARRARRERLVDVDDVERQRAERLLDRARHVNRERRGPPAGGRERQHLADAEHERLVAARSSSSSGCELSARRLSRTSASSSDGAIISTRWPRRASSSETRATYSLTSPPTSHANGVDLRDRESLAAHDPDFMPAR